MLCSGNVAFGFSRKSLKVLWSLELPHYNFSSLWIPYTTTPVALSQSFTSRDRFEWHITEHQSFDNSWELDGSIKSAVAFWSLVSSQIYIFQNYEMKTDNFSFLSIGHFFLSLSQTCHTKRWRSWKNSSLIFMLWLVNYPLNSGWLIQHHFILMVHDCLVQFSFVDWTNQC